MLSKPPLAASALLFLAACAAPAPHPQPRQGPDTAPEGQQAAGEQQTARTRIPPVVVTARKWEEQLQDVPRSLSSVSGDTIREAGVTSIEQAARYVPNTLITEFSSRRLSFPYVRGVGSGQGDPAVATFVDGVPQLTTSSTNLPMLGVERVEFLRGPGGVLYGRNTIGGVIHVVSELPAADHTAVDAGVSFGNYRQQDYRVSMSTPILADELGFAAALLHSRRDGYTKNDLSGNDVDDKDQLFGRGQLYWTPDDQNEVRFVVYGERARDGGFVLSDLSGLRDRPHRITQDFEGSQDRDIAAGSLTWNHLGGDYELTSITAVQDWSIAETADFDFSPIDGIRRFTDEGQSYVHQELRIGSTENAEIELGQDAALRWLFGVSGFYSDSDRSAANEFRPAGAGRLFPPTQVGTDRSTGTFQDWAVGVFGQLTVTLAERIELAGALRYDYEAKEADINRQFESPGPVIPVSSVQQREHYDEVLPRLSAAWRPTDEARVYALAARGFKAGGFNLTAPTGQVAFGPETSWTYEAGVKQSWLEDKLVTNAAVFYVDWEDMQLSQFDASSGGYVSNAGEARSQGIELEVLGRPTEDLEVFGGLGWLDTEFKSFVDSFGQDVSGRSLPFAPELMWNLGAQYSRALNEKLRLFVRGEWSDVGKFYYDAGNRAGERYGLANFRVGIGGSRWRLDAWIRNAFDEEFVPIAFQPSPLDPTLFVGENGAPRTYGVTLALSF